MGEAARRKRRRSTTTSTGFFTSSSPSLPCRSSPRSRHPRLLHHDRRFQGPDGCGDSGGGKDIRTAPTKGFTDLPYDLLVRIAANFDAPNLRAAGMVCRSWWDALRSLREAMLLFRWGKRFKHGRDIGSGGTGYAVQRDRGKALDSFVKAAAKGSARAMVDAGLMHWEMGNKDEARAMYREAAELGHPVGQFNLATSYLEAEPPNQQEAHKLLRQAAASGYPRAQYALALCYQHGQGVGCNLYEAAKWYLKAAENGNPRAMYNVSLCYSMGEGIPQSNHQAENWLKQAANSGHGRAQCELGYQFFKSGNLMKALVYLELATRAGESAALPIRNAIFDHLPQTSRLHALSAADKWKPSRYHV